jgi:hypothetical protein
MRDENSTSYVFVYMHTPANYYQLFYTCFFFSYSYFVFKDLGFFASLAPPTLSSYSFHMQVGVCVYCFVVTAVFLIILLVCIRWEKNRTGRGVDWRERNSRSSLKGSNPLKLLLDLDQFSDAIVHLLDSLVLGKTQTSLV